MSSAGFHKFKDVSLDRIGPLWYRVKVEVMVPNLNKGNVRISGTGNNNRFHDWRSNLVALGRRTLGPQIITEME